MSHALKNVTTKRTPQTERARADQVRNNAGGYVFAVSDKTRLERFLILGTDGGTYYASERDITRQNYDFLIELAHRDLPLLIDTTVEVSDTGRAAKNSPAIFALAVAMTNCRDTEKAAVRDAVLKVCRTSTHIFEFAQYLENLGGWGRAKRAAIAGWYESKSPESLAYQAVKYRQRNGWTHRDLLRLSHPQGLNGEVVNFILGKPTETNFKVIEGFVKAQAATNVDALVKIVVEYALPWEAVPTNFLNEPKLWKALLANGLVGQTALVRNVTRMEKIGAFDDLVFAENYAHTLANEELIRKGRIHPIAMLNALYMYRAGGEVTPVVAGALEDGFYTSFNNVEPSNVRTMLAIDVSGSMRWEKIAGLRGLTPADAAAVMAMVTVRTEPYVNVYAFSTKFDRLNIGPRDSIETVVNRTSRLWMGGTDCSLPMVMANENDWNYDHFVIYTDNETWAGHNHPYQALKDYRKASGINAKLTTVGMTSTGFSIADPSDIGMLDVVGFDANAPKVIAEFGRS